ncbi:MAG: DUF6785 family protein [Candidatus Bathyarchaeia archaeon]
MSVEVKSVLKGKTWAMIIIFAVFMSFIGVLSAPFAPTWCWSILFGTATGPIVVLFITLIISKISGRVFSPQMLALLYATSSLSLAFCWSMVPYGILHNAATTRLVTNEPYTSSIAKSWVFGPTDPTLVVPLQTGGAAVPWDAWSPFIAWWTLYAIFWLIFWTGWMALLQERWIEVEKLPFPFAITGTMQITFASTTADRRLKFFLAGFIIGAVVIIPVILHALFPWIPDLWGWASPPYLTWWFGVMNLAGVPATRIIPVWSFLAVNPMIYALFYLFPLKILFSVWFFNLVGVLIPSQIAWYMGYYAGIQETGWRPGFLVNQPPFKWNGIWLGSFIGLLLMWFALNTSYMKSLFKKPPDEERKAIPYRVGWIMILVSTIALISMLSAAGANPIGAVLIVFTMWLLFLSSIRVYGFCGTAGTAWMAPFDWTHYPSFVKYVYYPGMTIEKVTTEYTTTMMLANRFTGELMGENNTQFGMAFAIPMAYKVGYDTGTHPKDITKVILVAGIISAVIGFPTAIWFDYTFGTSNTPMQMYDAWWIWVHASVPQLESGMPAAEPVWPYIIVGIILTMVLSFLNFRYVWWPLDPAGVALSINGGGSAWLFPSLFAWIVKSIVMRIGGTKLNDEVATPIAVGVLVGYWVLMFLGAVAGLIKFFIPA